MLKRITIRNLDKELYGQARSDALERGIGIGTWINEAIYMYLNIEEHPSEYCRKQGWQEPE